ncbi:alpha-ketoglutarate-dependent dioxygenase AlkB [Rhizobacter sp. LjRoot28]|uniref:alpha-ketoglutarate-dependent dioxygenase AlkB n=1 Tax=Rhizobacter sp. LjRoot28 TaxID=3342309 RepID=UPI003ED05AD7
MDGQRNLFDEDDDGGGWPLGWHYEPAFIDETEEAALIAAVGQLPLAPAQYKGYTARREVLSFGSRFDFDTNTLLPGDPLPDFLIPLRSRIAGLAGVEARLFEDALVSRYAAGTPLGWHRDVPDFELVAGVSLGGWARLRFRPWPPGTKSRRQVLTAHVAPRSAYLIGGPARWQWQHSVAPTDELRWSITLRTRRQTTPR